MDDLRAEVIDLLCALDDDELRRVVAYVREMRHRPSMLPPPAVGLEMLLEDPA